MQDAKHEILVWLPSPMGDAILATPALRAIRRHFKSSRISFFARPAVRELLSPSDFNDIWLEQRSKDTFKIAKTLRPHKFALAILLKNSFASALAVFLARIPSRIGYAREGRSLFLTDKLYPPRLPKGKFKPVSAIDYYLAIASWLGAETNDRNLEISVDPQAQRHVRAKLAEALSSQRPLVIIVPGGAFGPSKCWPSDRFAQTTDWLIEEYKATVVVSVASDPTEKQIAREICDSSKHKLISLAEKSVTLGELKALFSKAQLVISNDTGPRHIAIALGRKLVTLFGPNDPVWTDTGYEDEIQIVGDVFCAPCARPVCRESEHLCMQSIPVEMVCDAAGKLLKNHQTERFIKAGSGLVRISDSLRVATDYEAAFRELGLTSVDAVFSFKAGRNLTKDNLARHRSRLQFEINAPLAPTTVFLKRYDRPPMTAQLKNWYAARTRASCAFRDVEVAGKLSAAGINTPRTVAYGEQWGTLLEKRSFVITEKIPNAESLERKLPDYFEHLPTPENLKLRRAFIVRLASFIRRFHETDYRHRDLYFSHIFCGSNDEFYLIDLARAFRPALLAERFRRKDIAQIHYSAPAKYFSNTDRLRFYLSYTGRRKLTEKDKEFIRKVINKAQQMARHNIKHGRPAPCQG
jgi:heptosyltransferase-2